MAGLFTLTSFDSREQFCNLRERDAALERYTKFEAKVTEYYAKTTKLDGTRHERRLYAENAAECELGYRP
jgi:hypothetical protein